MSIIPVPVRTRRPTTPPMRTGDASVSRLELLGLLACGVAMLAMYTWFVIDVAATVAVKRVEDAVNAWKDEVDDLDNMMER
jgi:hypothetical protein